jgi:hypothetical protein
MLIPHALSRQPSQPVNQCKKVSPYQDPAGFVPRVVQKRSGSPATAHHLCNCTGELCVHPVHLFTKLGTRPLTKSGGFPTPCPNENLRGPPADRGSGTSSSLEELMLTGSGARIGSKFRVTRVTRVTYVGKSLYLLIIYRVTPI